MHGKTAQTRQFGRCPQSLGAASGTTVDVAGLGRQAGLEPGTYRDAPARPEPFAAPAKADGIRVMVEFDAALLVSGTVISASPEQEPAWGVGCATCPSPPLSEALTIRLPQPATPVRQTMTKPADTEHRTLAQGLPVGWRRIGDLNPGWDHSQTALAVRRHRPD